jgi:hypothetical protein
MPLGKLARTPKLRNATITQLVDFLFYAGLLLGGGYTRIYAMFSFRGLAAA